MDSSRLNTSLPELSTLILRPFLASLRWLALAMASLVVIGYVIHWRSTHEIYQNYLLGFYGPEVRARAIAGRWDEVQQLCERIGGLSEVGEIRFTRLEPGRTEVCSVIAGTRRPWTLVSETIIPISFSVRDTGELGVLKVYRFDNLSMPLLLVFLVASGLMYFTISSVWMRRVQVSVEEHVVAVGELASLIRQQANGADMVETVGSLHVRSHEMHQIQGAIIDYLVKVKTLRDLEIKSTRDAAQKDMLQQLAHDLRSPLSAIQLISGTKRFFSEQKAQEVLSSAVAAIRGQLEKAMTVTRGGTLISEVVDASTVRKVMSDIIRLNQMAHANINFSLNMCSDDAEFNFDCEELRRVLQNLVTNSREHLESVSPSHGSKIELEFKCQSGFFEFVVKDNGTGLPDEVVKKFGEKGMTVGKEQGNGLGLAAALSFAESARGRVEFSTSSSGTEVRIVLPGLLPKP